MKATDSKSNGMLVWSSRIDFECKDAFNQIFHPDSEFPCDAKLAEQSFETGRQECESEMLPGSLPLLTPPLPLQAEVRSQPPWRRRSLQPLWPRWQCHQLDPTRYS
ncbi:hypothetical protein MC885_020688 [Smutsia gigantea]|nr:hypothetical protein MC885_020688 [Smutsia gigantea]